MKPPYHDRERAAYAERQAFERQYHDDKYREPGEGGRTQSTRATRAFWRRVGTPAGLTVLDFGCGTGWLAVQLAQAGNRVHAFDISAVLIARARELAEASHVADRTTFHEMAAEDLVFPDNSFDLVVGSSILHHTELTVTLGRIHHVLKPGGRALFIEPLNENLCLRAWRLATPWRRTRTERAFTKQDLAAVRAVFPAASFTYFGLTSMVTLGLLLLAPRSGVLHRVNRAFEAFDEHLLRSWPSLGVLSAAVIIELRK